MVIEKHGPQFRLNVVHFGFFQIGDTPNSELRSLSSLFGQVIYRGKLLQLDVNLPPHPAPPSGRWSPAASRPAPSGALSSPPIGPRPRAGHYTYRPTRARGHGIGPASARRPVPSGGSAAVEPVSSALKAA